MAVDFVGLPEGRICLAQGATYLALAPKSNASYLAIDEALGEVRRNGSRIPPAHLRAPGFRGAEKLGRGVGYRYPHGEGGVSRGQRYLPEGLEDARYYEPKEVGFEARLREVLASLEGRDAQEPAEPEEPGGARGAGRKPRRGASRRRRATSSRAGLSDASTAATTASLS